MIGLNLNVALAIDNDNDRSKDGIMDDEWSKSNH